MMLSFNEFDELIVSAATILDDLREDQLHNPLDDDSSLLEDEVLLTEASARNLAPAVSLAMMLKQSATIKTALRKVRDETHIEMKIDALSQALDAFSSKTTALAALAYFLTKTKKPRKR